MQHCATIVFKFPSLGSKPELLSFTAYRMAELYEILAGYKQV